MMPYLCSKRLPIVCLVGKGDTVVGLTTDMSWVRAQLERLDFFERLNRVQLGRWVVGRPDVCDVHHICQIDCLGIVAKDGALKQWLRLVPAAPPPHHPVMGRRGPQRCVVLPIETFALKYSPFFRTRGREGD